MERVELIAALHHEDFVEVKDANVTVFENDGRQMIAIVTIEGSNYLFCPAWIDGNNCTTPGRIIDQKDVKSTLDNYI